MAGHSPFPWVSDESEHDAPYQDIRIVSGGRTVCTLWIDDAPVPEFNAQQHENAKLILALPRLILALRTIKAGAGNPEFVYNAAKDVLAELGHDA